MGTQSHQTGKHDRQSRNMIYYAEDMVHFLLVSTQTNSAILNLKKSINT